MAKIFLIDDGNYSKRVEEALTGHTVIRFGSLKGINSEIVAKKPQMILMPDTLALSFAAKQLLKNFEFIPFMAYGEFGKTPAHADRRIRKLLTFGYASCATVGTIIERSKLLDAIESVLWKTLASESVWDKERSITLEDRRSEIKRNVSAAVIVIAAVGLLGFIFREKIIPEEKLIPKMYSIPYSGISGIAVRKNEIWGCDWKSQSIYQQTAGQKLQIKHVFSFPEIRLTGMAAGDGILWTLDSWKKIINVHRLDERLSVAKEIACPGETPNSITYDGNYLLVSDAASNKVYVLKPEDNYSVIKEFSLPGSGVTAIYSDGKYLWSLDSEDNKLYKCRFSDFEIKVESIFIPPEYETFRATGIAGDKNYIWLASEKESRIYRYPKKFLETL